MARGKAHGLVSASGVLCGSLAWGLMAASGIAVLLSNVSGFLPSLRIVAGLYLLCLSWKAARSSLNSQKTKPVFEQSGLWQTFRRGLFLHLMNPKAVLAWLSTITLGTSQTSPSEQAIIIVVGCGVLGLVIFGGYAALFATPRLRSVYMHLRRVIEAFTAVFFGAAGVALLTRRW